MSTPDSALSRIVAYLRFAGPSPAALIAADLSLSSSLVEDAVRRNSDSLFRRLPARPGSPHACIWGLASRFFSSSISDETKAASEHAPPPAEISARAAQVRNGLADDSRTGKPLPAWDEATCRSRAGESRQPERIALTPQQKTATAEAESLASSSL